MKAALLIAVMLASAVLVDSRLRGYRRSSSGKRDVTFQEEEEALQNAATKLEKVVHDAESKSALEMDFEEVDENNDALAGDNFEKKVATLQEAAADMEERVNEVEEDAALGLLEKGRNGVKIDFDE